jgi:DNA polymerase-1
VAATQKPRLVILDSHGILFRAFFAFANSDKPLMTSKGELTFATHGYAETLIRVLDFLKPTHICAAWDAPGPTFRHEASEIYKATRRPTPSELLTQMARVREMLIAFNIPIYEMPGFEADDVAGTIAKRTAAEGIETYIATLDTDLVQVLGPNIKLFMFRPYQRDTVEYDEAKAAERWGFSPQYMIDFKALRGDSSDNVEGVKGIGDKTATDLIREFGPAEAIFDNIDKVRPAVAKKLAGQREHVLASKHLVTIKTDLPVEFDFESCRVQDYNRDAVLGLFRELEFRVLSQRLEEVLGSQPTAANQAVTEVPNTYETVTSEEGLASLVQALREAGTFGVAGLSSAGDAVHPFPLGLSFATEPGRAWYVPFGHAPRLDDATPQLPRAIVMAALRPIFEDPALTKTAYGSKYLMHLLDRLDCRLEGNSFDVAIAAFLLGETSSTLNPLVSERLGIAMVNAQTLTGTGRNAVSLAQVEMAKVAEYGCQQADMLLRIRPQLEQQLN